MKEARIQNTDSLGFSLTGHIQFLVGRFSPRGRKTTHNKDKVPSQKGITMSNEPTVYEVFRREKAGAPMVHTGSVAATSPDLALIYAKEVYGRRGESSGRIVD